MTSREPEFLRIARVTVSGTVNANDWEEKCGPWTRGRTKNKGRGKTKLMMTKKHDHGSQRNEQKDQWKATKTGIKGRIRTSNSGDLNRLHKETPFSFLYKVHRVKLILHCIAVCLSPCPKECMLWVWLKRVFLPLIFPLEAFDPLSISPSSASRAFSSSLTYSN